MGVVWLLPVVLVFGRELVSLVAVLSVVVSVVAVPSV